MENHIVADSVAMFELSIFKNRKPHDEVAFFLLFNGLRRGDWTTVSKN
jgi:hypothetical protein